MRGRSEGIMLTLPPRFRSNAGVSIATIRETEKSLGQHLPSDYVEFMQHWNGGEGFFDGSYLILWRVEDLALFNREYQVSDYAPGLLLFGSNGGGEGFGFWLEHSPPSVVMIPFIGMDPSAAEVCADSFTQFLAWLRQR